MPKLQRPYSAPGRVLCFTLTELIVVFGIITVLLSLILPALARVRGRAWRARCAAHLRQTGLGHLIHLESHDGSVLKNIDPGYGSWMNSMHVDMGLPQEIFQCTALRVHFSPLQGKEEGYRGLNIKAGYLMNAVREDFSSGNKTWDIRGWQNGANINRIRTPDSIIFITEISDTFRHLSSMNMTNAASGRYSNGGLVNGGVRHLGRPEGWSLADGRWNNDRESCWTAWGGSDTDHGNAITGNTFKKLRQVGAHHNGGFNALMGGGSVRYMKESPPESWIARESFEQ